MESTELTTKVGIRQFLAVGGGQAIENYDWMLYGLVAAYLGPQFFPGQGPVHSTLNALAVFGVAFAARPLGALIFGPMADRIGRKPLMLWAVGSMSAFSFLMGLLPTAVTVGTWAAVLLVLLRMLQGMSIGVEQPLLASYGLEIAPKGREAWYAGLLQLATQFGILLASLTAFFCTLALGDSGMEEGGWRIPFIVGGLLGLGVLWLRRSLPETVHAEEAEHRTSKEVRRAVRANPLALVAIIFVVGGTQVINYGWTSGLPSTARAVFGQSGALIFGLTSLLSVIIMLMAPIAGKIADHFGMGRTFVWTRLLSIPFAFVLLLYADPGVVAFVLAMAGGAVILPFALSFFNAISASLVPAGHRVTAVGLGYSLGVALFGGTASYLLVWLSSMDLYWVFPVYIGVILLLGVLTYRIAVTRTGLHNAVYSTAEPDRYQHRPAGGSRELIEEAA
ncbi:MFS transporter, MHS family, alpha-ketoglutarate permease [Micromonospora viridifaciens]|uniref:MFS transporter, MHS family, alpha-ketoglutarate permease n=1 Tax=Micromonospora viridifaciens TaxID=1881 RepID=A0A1C4WZ73_MICVI|nr:MFS transporter [Micromonospora viridifaciens]SCF01532.1 MFS transporter, MHS family, alpha-ketoglutarate permease [Micromonospora viridifaciens]